MYQTLLDGRKTDRSALWSPSKSIALRKLGCANDGTAKTNMANISKARFPCLAKIFFMTDISFKINFLQKQVKGACERESKIYHLIDAFGNKNGIFINAAFIVQ